MSNISSIVCAFSWTLKWGNKKNDNIKGIQIPNTDREAKQNSHADDTILILSDTNCIKETFKVFDLYCKASCAKLNKSKSEISVLGRRKISKTELKDLEIKECNEIVQLGKNKNVELGE